MKRAIICACGNHMTLQTVKGIDEVCYFQCEKCGQLERKQWNELMPVREAHNYT